MQQFTEANPDKGTKTMYPITYKLQGSTQFTEANPDKGTKTFTIHIL